jgi:hypothetical protein
VPRRDNALPDLAGAIAALGNPPLFPGDVTAPDTALSATAPAPRPPDSTFEWKLADLTHAIYQGTVEPASKDADAMHASLRKPSKGEAVGVLRRRRVGIVRKRRVRKMSGEQLRKTLDDTEFWLGAMAAERAQTQQ